MTNNVDFAPTLLDFAGVSKPDFMQGRSFLPMLEGQPAPKDWPESTYYRYWMHMAHHDNPAHLGIRTRSHKLIYFYGKPLGAAGAKKETTEPYWELYDLEKDPHEMNNLIDNPEYGEIRAELQTQLAELQNRVGDQMPPQE